MTTRVLPQRLTVPLVAGREGQTEPRQSGLGSPGVCSGEPSLQIWVFDDSPSVISLHGTDPLARRYVEARSALRTVARSCRCRQERIGVLHFDAAQGRVRPTAISGLGGWWISRSLRAPAGWGSSELLPALAIAEEWAEQAPAGTVIRLVVFSDFALTDDDPGAVIARLENFPGEVTAVVLGAAVWPGTDARVRVRHVGSHERPGAFARTLIGELTCYRLGVHGRSV